MEEVMRHPLAAEVDDYMEYKRLRHEQQEKRMKRDSAHRDMPVMKEVDVGNKNSTRINFAGEVRPTGRVVSVASSGLKFAHPIYRYVSGRKWHFCQAQIYILTSFPSTRKKNNEYTKANGVAFWKKNRPLSRLCLHLICKAYHQISRPWEDGRT